MDFSALWAGPRGARIIQVDLVRSIFHHDRLGNHVQSLNASHHGDIRMIFKSGRRSRGWKHDPGGDRTNQAEDQA